VDDSLGRGRHDRQPHLLQGKGRRIEKLADMLGHIGIDPLVSGGGDGVAFAEGPACEAALQGLRGAVEADIVLCRGENDLGRGLRRGFLDFDIVARPHAGVGALQPVQADDVEARVLVVGSQRPRGCRPLADDLDDVALGQAKVLHQLDRQACHAMAAVDRRQMCDLNAPDQCIDRRH
jgi:hypothetical protein